MEEGFSGINVITMGTHTLSSRDGTSNLLQPARMAGQIWVCFLIEDGMVSSPLPFFPRGSSKIEEACEIYARAANMFKMAKNWSGAYPQPTGPALHVALKSPLHPQEATA